MEKEKRKTSRKKIVRRTDLRVKKLKRTIRMKRNSKINPNNKKKFKNHKKKHLPNMQSHHRSHL